MYYFADYVSDKKSEAGSASNGGPNLIRHIDLTEPDNVMVITDEDLDYMPEHSQTP